MAYTVDQMMQHAELHYFSAQKELQHAEQSTDDDWTGICAAKAAAQAQAGLLALGMAILGTMQEDFT